MSTQPYNSFMNVLLLFLGMLPSSRLLLALILSIGWLVVCPAQASEDDSSQEESTELVDSGERSKEEDIKGIPIDFQVGFRTKWPFSFEQKKGPWRSFFDCVVPCFS